MITKMEKSAQKTVKTGKYKYWTIDQLEARRNEIVSRRGGGEIITPPSQVSASDLQKGKQRLKKPPPSPPKEKKMTPFEEAVVSRRPAIEVDDDDDNENWLMAGSGFSRKDEKTINNVNLYVAIGSLQAGNSSPKLQKEIKSLVNRLVKGGN